MTRRYTKKGVYWIILLLLVGVAFVHFVMFKDKGDVVETKELNKPTSGKDAVATITSRRQQRQQRLRDEFDNLESVRQQQKGVVEMQERPRQTATTQDTYFVRRKTKVTPLNFVFSITGPATCDAAQSLVVVLVLTEHDHVNERNAIRETWGSVVKTKQWGEDRVSANVLLIFMLGKPDDSTKSELVKNENEEFHDIVEANFQESYYNLTYKVLMGYKWVKQFCPSAQYIVKVDEDTFLNMRLLVQILGITDLQNTVLGPYFQSAPVERGGKHRVEKESYPLDQYPPHVKGNFYIMPAKLAFSVVDASEYMPYVCIEDAHITGILIKVVEGKHIGITTSAYNPVQKGAPEVCDFLHPFKLAAQKVSPDRKRQIWKTITSEHKCEE